MDNYDSEKNRTQQVTDDSRFVRPRLNAVLAQAVKKPLTIVCAAMGCGKTRAVYDFSQSCGMPVIWVQLSESDNISFHYWENSIQSISKTDEKLAEEYRKLGFPGTEDKFLRFLSMRQLVPTDKKYLLVFDDFHHIKNETMLEFFERSVNNVPDNRSIVLISREFPNINISSQMVRDNVSIINEDELNFTENELYRFLLEKGLGAETNSLERIYGDTKGWAFIIDFVSRMLEKRPGYAGYVQSAIKQDIFQLIETEIWSNISAGLKELFLRLSLTDHRSAELVGMIAGDDMELIGELKEQNAFVRFDKYIDYYYVHSLFLDFLETKRKDYGQIDVEDTYSIIASWCLNNDFIVDALLNYEKIEDYESIVKILHASSTRFLMENVQDLLAIFNRIPQWVYDTIEVSAAVHVQLVMNTGDLIAATTLLRQYEEKYLALPENNSFRNRMLGNIYYQWAIYRMLLCTIDDNYDFDKYTKKVAEYLTDLPVINSGNWYQHPPGMWTNLAGHSREGALQAFLNTLSSSMESLEMLPDFQCNGIEDLCRGELLFYQNNIKEAEPLIKSAAETALKHAQFEIVWRAMFYQLRISVSKGEPVKINQTLSDMERYLEIDNTPIRYLIYELILGWYYHALGQLERIPIWLKDRFTFNVFYSNTLENYGNHLKAKYRYLTNDIDDLIAYIENKKQRPDLVLLERIELLVMEACARQKINDMAAAVTVLNEVYNLALPNDITMPFIEFGKDMRKLLVFAGTDEKCEIPHGWLNSMKQKINAYSRRQAQIMYEYKMQNEIDAKIVLTPRETEVLRDLYNRLSRVEIADKYGLSVNTVKAHISSIYEKLNARNRADIYRIAAEQKLL